MIALQALLITASLLSTPYGPSDAAAWSRSLGSRCPRHHIQTWMPEGNQVDLIDAFVSTLPRAQQVRHARLAGVAHVCAAEVAGQSCEKIVELHAVRRLGLLDRFSSYACSEAICTEPAICSTPTTSPARQARGR